MQVAIPVTEADVELQGLAHPQGFVQPEPQQHPVGQPHSPAVSPACRRLGDGAVGGRGEVAVEPVPVGQDRLGRHRSFGSPVQNPPELVGVVPAGGGGRFGDLLDPDDLAHPAACGARHLGQARDVARQPGVDQPVADARSGQEHAGQLRFGVRAASFPIVLGRSVFRQAEQRRTVRSHREPELGVES